MASESTFAANDQWRIVARWQEYEGEGSANLLRILAVGVVYAAQLIQFHLLATGGAADQAFHRAATALAAAWSLSALAILLCLRRRFFPKGLKYLSTGCDLALLTAAALLGGRSHSPLVYGFFLLLALAGLRGSTRLIGFATVGAMLGYFVLVAASDDHWFDGIHATPLAEQLVVELSLALFGLLLAQNVRRARLLAEDYARRMIAVAGEAADSQTERAADDADRRCG